MKAVVTGCAGFLGSHLVKSLLDDGYYVHGLDNLQTGSYENMKQFSENPKFSFTVMDISLNQTYYRECDEYYNLGCAASPPKYQMNPAHTFWTSINGIKLALDNGLKYNAKVFQASTSEVYGDPTCTIQSETYWGNVNPNGIRSCYDEGKRAAETLMCDYNRMFGSNIRIARIFNTYGPFLNAEDGRVVSNFINQALRNQDITIYGDGQQTRSFCYASDLISGIRKLMKSDIITPVNLGNPLEFTMLELAEKVIAKTGSSSKLVYMPLPGDDPKQRKPDISKAKDNLNWYPKVNLDEGLDKTIEYFKGIM